MRYLARLEVLAVIALAAAMSAACGKSGEDQEGSGSADPTTAAPAPAKTRETDAPSPGAPPPRPERQADRVAARHVLLGFEGAATPAERTKEDALALARDLLARIRAGADMDQLVVEHSDDPSRAADHGTRRLVNFGIPPGPGETPRARLPAYAEVVFALDVGEAAIVEHDQEKNLLGIFVVKRIE